MSTYQNQKAKSSFRIKKKRLSAVQKITLTTIAIAMLTVIISTIALFLSNPEYNVKKEITNLSTDYYENYLYKKIINSKKTENLDDIFKDYNETNPSTIYLRQLLYHKEIDQKTINFIKTYCDENKTYVKFHPEHPYSKSSYSISYNYSCDFE